MTKIECHVKKGLAPTADEGPACAGVTAPRRSTKDALHNCEKLRELPRLQVLVCDSVDAAEAAQQRFDGKVVATAWTDAPDYADWSVLKGRSVGLLVEPKFEESLVAAIRPFALLIKFIERPAGVLPGWTIADAPESFNLKAHARIVYIAPQPAPPHAAADATETSVAEVEGPVALTDAPVGTYAPVRCAREGSIDCIGLIEPVARSLLGEPNEKMSSPTELRYGAKGSLSIDLLKGVWHCHETGDGGGLFDLILHKGAARTHADAALWIKRQGFIAQPLVQVPKRKSEDASMTLRHVRENFKNFDAASLEQEYIAEKRGSADGVRVVSFSMWGWGPFKGRSIHGWLAVPAYAEVGNAGDLMAVQFIGPGKGEKLNSATPIGGATFTVGIFLAGEIVYVAEGIGHAWSLNAVTGRAAVVSFSAGNIKVVAEKVAAAGGIPIIVPDRGQEAAAANTAASLACWFAPLPEDLPHGADVNDLHRQHGADAVSAVLDAAVAPDRRNLNESVEDRGAEAGKVTFEDRVMTAAACKVPEPAVVLHRDGEAACETDGVQVASVPEREEYPCWRVFDEPLFHDRRRYYGVYFFGLKAPKSESGEPRPFSVYVCGPLHVEAQTHAFDGLNCFGRLLRWRTSAGRWQTWAMPVELLAGDAKELRACLMSHGLEIDPDAHQYLKRYLSGEANHLKKVYCVLQTGWTSDAHDAFVLPAEVLGPKASQAVLQVEHPEEDPYERRGTAAAWRDRVAAMAPGNSALTLGISIALAGPLLDIVRAESGGVHLWGDSSTGKSTVLEVAASVWGHPKRFPRSWRTTANGLEGAAAHRTDTLLALDEIGQCEPAHLSDIVYMVGNGVGKQRANISGAARSVKMFRVAVLSTGETSVAAALANNGSTPRAGQGVRLIDVCVVGRAHGV